MAKKRVFSGIQPSGNLHIGNYIGAIRHWVNRQDEKNNFFMLADLHAITVPQDPVTLSTKIRELAALYLACGIDTQKSVVFVQSHNPDHAQLAWALNCFTSLGQLERMTQYKDKSKKQKEVSVGLFDYPVLMAADILLYDTDEVPVGDDQKQHVELTRDIAQRFNSHYQKYIFNLPQAVINQTGARIMSLQNPNFKMSKSDSNQSSAIFLLDPPDLISQKIKRAVTDSGTDIRSGEDKPALTNLLCIYSQLTDKPITKIETLYTSKNYGQFKSDLAEVIIEALKPIQDRYHQLIVSKQIDQLLSEGTKKAYAVSHPKLSHVFTTIGLK